VSAVRAQSASAILRAPFPWFGGKSRAASLIWERFGDVPNYVEPFAGSLAVLLGRPHAPRTETVNDRDAYLANFWRALQAEPDAVARWADWPVNESDLQARHLWLVNDGREIVSRLGSEPDFYDVRVAGWWVWGICQWIGAEWCSGRGPHRRESMAAGVTRKLPHLGDAGMGVHRQLPHLGNAGMGVHRQLPHLGDAGRGDEAPSHLTDYLRALADRLRRVRVACGDWRRVTGESVTFKHGITGILLDPPYGDDQHAIQYAAQDRCVAADVRAWALENGGNPLLRIALCGYAGEHDDLIRAGWTEVPWKARGGYGSQGVGRGRENSARERIWFSPHCLNPATAAPSLFDASARLTSPPRPCTGRAA
jgi:hypothetical protein